MDYQEVLSRFTYDDGTDIMNRAANAATGDYRENREDRKSTRLNSSHRL